MENLVYIRRNLAHCLVFHGILFIHFGFSPPLLKDYVCVCVLSLSLPGSVTRENSIGEKGRILVYIVIQERQVKSKEKETKHLRWIPILPSLHSLDHWIVILPAKIPRRESGKKTKKVTSAGYLLFFFFLKG